MKSPRDTKTGRIIQSNEGLPIGRNNAGLGTKNKPRLSSGGRARANGRNGGGLSKRGTRREDRKIMDAIGGLYFLFHVSRIRSEGPLLRLHVLTAALMLTFSVIVSAKQSVGNPIDCVHTREIPVEAFNAYCWIHSTYFVTGAMLGVAGVNVAFPGVAPSFAFYPRQRTDHEEQHGRHRGSNNANPSIKHVKYYQWVAFCLVFQIAVFAIAPHLWLIANTLRVNSELVNSHKNIISGKNDVKLLDKLLALLVTLFAINSQCQALY